MRGVWPNDPSRQAFGARRPVVRDGQRHAFRGFADASTPSAHCRSHDRLSVVTPWKISSLRDLAFPSDDDARSRADRRLRRKQLQTCSDEGSVQSLLSARLIAPPPGCGDECRRPKRSRGGCADFDPRAASVCASRPSQVDSRQEVHARSTIATITKEWQPAQTLPGL